MVDPVTGAIVIAGLKYVGQPAAELVREFLGKVLTPTADAVGQVAAYPIQEWQRRRVERAAELLIDAAVIVQETDLELQAVPGRILWPILERGSLEDDDELQRRWVALLANASANPRIVSPAFPSILADLSQFDARLLDWIFEHYNPPEGRGIAEPMSITVASAMNTHAVDLTTVVLALSNLERLRLVQTSHLISEIERAELEPRFEHLFLTPFGTAFVRACRADSLSRTS
jgi:hypothetical protein